MDGEDKKKQSDEMREVMKVAQSLERAEEEEMMRKALEESQRLEQESK